MANAKQVRTTVFPLRFSALKNLIAKIRRHISREACTKAIISTVISRLDFHNALLVGTTEALRRPFQVLQNNAARLVTGTPRRAHVQPVLKEIHWMPVDQRII
eukprot:GHVO01059937.1.p1 GENE.GHVO01059937.1~~GHVO01059937.1.p1  ORF type:complete len:103 (+),score=5.84 GHVO01059937.1:322-630(+)